MVRKAEPSLPSANTSAEAAGRSTWRLAASFMYRPARTRPDTMSSTIGTGTRPLRAEASNARRTMSPRFWARCESRDAS